MWDTNLIKHKEFFQKDGISRFNRQLEQVAPEFVNVDERSFEDMLNFAEQYAQLLTYYNTNNEVHGDWNAFISNDITTVLSGISKYNAHDLKKYFDKSLLTFSNSPEKSNLQFSFQILIDACYQLESWYTKSVDGLALRVELENTIKAGVSDCLSSIIAYDKGNILLEGIETEATAIGCVYKNFGKLWYDSSAYSNWGLYMASISPDDATYSSTEDIVNRLTQLFATVYKGLNNIATNANVFIDETLTEWPNHNPYIALYFAFLKIFTHAQDSINTITTKHLEFFYEKVLQFSKKDAKPNSVYLVFNLAKNIATHKLDAGTKFKGGKDSDGKEVVYTLDEQIILNKATVSAIKNIFISDSGIYANTIGEGDSVLQSSKWKTFGEDLSLANANESNAISEFGFVLSSPILNLKEGIREITYTFNFKSFSQATLNLTIDDIKIDLSGEKEWLQPDIFDFDINDTAETLVIKARLGIADDAVVPFNAKVLTGEYDTAHPASKFVFSNNYVALSSLELDYIDIRVDVKELTSFIGQNDNGLLDTSKPFRPFGNQPVKGSNFYIGNEEIFQKNLSKLSFDVKWQDIPPNLHDKGHYKVYSKLDENIKRVNDSYVVLLDILKKREWRPIKKGVKLFFVDNNVLSECVSFSFEETETDVVKDATTKDNEEIETELLKDVTTRDNELIDISEYSNSLSRGFVRFKLGSCDFLHNNYPKIYTKAVLKINELGVDAAAKLEIELPNEPYTPTIESLEASYSSSERITFKPVYTEENKIEQMFHIHPFGYTEFEPKKNQRTTDGILFSNTILPSFKELPIVNNQEKYRTGELYIGIKDLEPPQNLSLYFDMAEGSADPDLDKPNLIYSYLSENKWVNFTNDEILEDTTDLLTKTGIIKVQMPTTATNNNIMLLGGLHWIRIAVIDDEPSLLCQAKNIYAQAAKVTFSDNKNAADFLETPLAKESISKLAVKDAAVKTISQYSASFDGTPIEKDSNYQIRISERLRHKNRAICQWDYEHLILENFEDIYKVKCLNHLNKEMISAPGNVTIVVLPEPGNEDVINILQPKVNVNIRENIKTYLQKYLSNFITLTVKNPYYTKVELIMKVDILPGYDISYYSEQLNSDLVKYICPWAFDKNEEIAFNNSIHFSGVLNYVDELEYIDHVTDLKMFKVENKNEIETKTETKEVKAVRPDEILISVDQHSAKINSCVC